MVEPRLNISPPRSSQSSAGAAPLRPSPWPRGIGVAPSGGSPSTSPPDRRDGKRQDGFLDGFWSDFLGISWDFIAVL